MNPPTEPSVAEAPYHCRRCDRPLTPVDVRMVKLGNTSAPMCLACGGPASPRVAPKTHADGTPDTGELLPHFMSAFGYVFRTDGLIAAATLGIAAALVGYIPIVGGIFSAGLFLTYAFAVIQHTARGDDDLPLPVDFVSFGDLAEPFVRFASAVVVGFLPAILGIYLKGDSTSLVLQLIEAVLVLCSVLYIPAAVALSAMSSGWFGAINPAPAVALILKLPKDYALTVAVLAGLMCVSKVISGLAHFAAMAMSLLPVLPTLASGFATALFPLVMARVLGILLRERKNELGLEP